MAMIDVGHNSPATWMTGPPSHNTMGFANGSTHLQPQQSRNVYPPVYQPAPDPALPPIPPKNEKELTREKLIHVLNHFSQLVAQHFGGRPIRLVVHGGACMLLHNGLYALSMQQQQMSPHLPRRTTTRDVDYILRSFIGEMNALGMMDAASRLGECIQGTARAFGLGLDWMNSDADIALPYCFDPSGKPYDPIYMSAIRPNNINLHTVYTAPNKLLTLISVTPFWAVSLKLVRYVKWDPGDICLLLRNGVVLSGTNWTPEQLESWLYTECWSMGYDHFDAVKKQQMKERILHAINQLKIWSEAVGVDDQRDRNRAREREKKREVDRGETIIPPSLSYLGRTVSAQDAMGGADDIGGQSAISSGWTSAHGKWPNPDVKSPPYRNGWNVLDWANGKWSPTGGGTGSGSDRGRRKGSTSKVRTRSHSRSRPSTRSNSRQREDIFIPESDDDDDDWTHINEHGRSSQPPPIPGQTQQWIYLNPNHAPNTTRPSSRQRSPDPYNGIYALPERGAKATGYGLDNLHNMMEASLKLYDHEPPQSSRPPYISKTIDGQTFNFPLYPTHDTTAAQRHALTKKSRKKKEKDKRRTKAIERARSSKWAPMLSSSPEAAIRGSDTDVSGDESDESSDEDRGRKGSRHRDGHWNEGGRIEKQRDEHLNGQPWHYNNYAVAGALQEAPYAHPSRQGSRHPSRSPKAKKRPPPLDISPPPAVPPIVHPNPHITEHDIHDATGQGGGIPALPVPAQRAQFQFEQQQKAYQKHLAEQSNKPTVKQVAENVARQIAAQQQAYGRNQSRNTYAQQPNGSHGGPLRGTASWTQPSQTSVNHPQSWFYQQQQQQQQQRPTNRLRSTKTGIYN